MLRYVLVHNFGYVRWISLRRCHSGVKASTGDMVQALVPRKFIEDGPWWRQSRVRGAQIAWIVNLENAEFCSRCPFPSTFLYFSGPAGVRSLRARVLLWQDVVCGDDSFIVSRIVQAIFFLAGGRSRILVEEKKMSVVRRFGS